MPVVGAIIVATVGAGVVVVPTVGVSVVGVGVASVVGVGVASVGVVKVEVVKWPGKTLTKHRNHKKGPDEGEKGIFFWGGGARGKKDSLTQSTLNESFIFIADPSVFKRSFFKPLIFFIL